MFFTEKVNAKGHPLITATHTSTLEITRERELTPRGNCILAVDADKSVYSLNPYLKYLLRKNHLVIIQFKTNDKTYDYLIARGHINLKLKDLNSIVIRKSSYIDKRTLCIKSSKSAIDINRKIINELKKNHKIIINIVVLGKE